MDSRSRLQELLPKLVLAPSFLIVLVFVYGFIAYTGFLSLTDSKMLPSYNFVGLSNYSKLWALPHWWRAISNLAIFASLYIVICSVLGLALAILLIGGVAGVGYFARDQIVRFWPPAIRLYDTIGVPVVQPMETGALGRGLVLQDLEVRRVATSGVEQVVVTGRVENRALVTRPVPPIEVRLLDASRTVVARMPLVVTAERLAPDQSVLVAATVETVPDGATRLEIGAQTNSAP